MGTQRTHLLDAVLVTTRLIACPWAVTAAVYLPALHLWKKSPLLGLAAKIRDVEFGGNPESQVWDLDFGMNSY